jgi:ABC-type proline/glycine betaine transport system substrate-binding protein
MKWMLAKWNMVFSTQSGPPRRKPCAPKVAPEALHTRNARPEKAPEAERKLRNRNAQKN